MDNSTVLTIEELYGYNSLERLFHNDKIVHSNGFKKIFINNDCVNAEVRYANFSDFTLCYQDWQLHRPFNLIVNHTYPLIKVQFEITGGTIYNSKIPDQKIEISASKYQCMYIPKVDGQIHYNSSRKVFDIYFKEEFLRQFLLSQGYGSMVISELFHPSITFFRHSQYIRMMQMDIISSIVDHHYSSDFAIDFIKCRTLELLLSVFNGAKSTVSKFATKQNDEIQIRKVKEYIDSNLSQEFHLFDLAKSFNLNEYKLKVLFKEIYNDTVFAYIRKRRMKLANTLLRSSDKSIKEIAFETGFKYAHHFTRNFVDYFGVLPKSIRQSGDK